MKGILLLNGEPYSGAIDAEGAVVYCCDGAYEWAKDRVRIDKNVGDFDSLGYIPFPPPEEVYPAEKNFTDGEIALFKMLKAGVDEIYIYGGGGGREDHFLGNLQLLYAAHVRGASARMITENSVIFAAGGKIPLGAFCGTTCAFRSKYSSAPVWSVTVSEAIRIPVTGMYVFFSLTVTAHSAAHILTGHYHNHVRPHLGYLLLDALLAALPYGKHRYHRGHTYYYTQHRKKRAELVGGYRTQGYLEKIGYTHITNDTNKKVLTSQSSREGGSSANDCAAERMFSL